MNKLESKMKIAIIDQSLRKDSIKLLKIKILALVSLRWTLYSHISYLRYLVDPIMPYFWLHQDLFTLLGKTNSENLAILHKMKI